MQIVFSSEPSGNLLCVTILDILTSCAYVPSLLHALSPQPHAARDRAQQQVPQHFDCAVYAIPFGFSSHCLLLLFASRRLALLENTRIQAESLKKLRFSQFLLVWTPRLSWSKTQGFEFSAAQSVDHDDQLTLMKHLVEIKMLFPCWILFLCLAQKQGKFCENSKIRSVSNLMSCRVFLTIFQSQARPYLTLQLLLVPLLWKSKILNQKQRKWPTLILIQIWVCCFSLINNDRWL